MTIDRADSSTWGPRVTQPVLRAVIAACHIAGRITPYCSSKNGVPSSHVATLAQVRTCGRRKAYRLPIM
ncbi:hypothetical protein [Streptosporangium sp. NPDC049046]|uniref:hypothetical protein n=1 Tax=Streptosporangium sp. NPDC049046 TaxID=3155031 RepID=UPI003418D6FB